MAYEKSADTQVFDTDYRYFKGLSLQKLGLADEAKLLFTDLLETGRNKLTKESEQDFFAKFGEKQTDQLKQASAHYSMALGYLGLEQKQQAKQELTLARQLVTDDNWINVLFNQLY